MGQLRHHSAAPYAFVLGWALILGLLVSVTARAEPEGETYTLFASGDTALARWVHSAIYQHGTEWALEDVAEMVSSADIALTNLECVVSSRGRFWDKGERRPFLYRARPEMLDVLTDVGFDVLVTANNHSMDYGPDALLEQIEIIEACGMANVGTGKNKADAAKPAFVKVGDVIVAFIGMEPNFPKFGATKDQPGTFHARGNAAVLKALEQPVAEARKHADLVVFTPHWGNNWTENPTQKRIELGREIIDMGVDAILGHCAHHIHGIDIYKGKPIVFDMGSFFFDTVGKKRLRLSAGYVLEFGRGGFTKLTMHPLRLLSSRTTYAKGKDLDRIQDLLVGLTRQINPEIELEKQGDSLTISFEPDTPAPSRKSDPPQLLETGQTRPVPEEIRNRKSNVVFDEPPEWTAGFDPVELEGGVVVLGARHSEAAWPTRGFSAEIALKVPGPFTGGRWEGTVMGEQRDGEGRFVYPHPIADGGWVPEIWKAGQIVVDHTLVRPTEVDEGIYDLYWRFENRMRRKVAKPVDPSKGRPDGFVKIGEFTVTTEGIPSGAAGVAWHGLLPKEAEPVVNDGIEVESPLPRWVIGLAVGGAFVLVLAVVLVIRSRRKRRSSGSR
jgi:poly-gamma-glutamate capsule biosynthesis protein CapA/YwtB (metallophosphatase superfamily)